RVDSSVLEYVQKARQVKAEEMKIRGLIDKVDNASGFFCFRVRTESASGQGRGDENPRLD
ncbi:hypothetical protein, partial [Streptococcus sanguinis]|uniref:hypothetical protein n=1 Tax=Streptococcus sanguinis TaxID=1305 RepID=UPI00115FCE31